MKKITTLFILIVFFSMFTISLSANKEEGPKKITDIKDLENRLSTAIERERIELLAQAIEIYLKKNPKKALDYGKEALQLLAQFKDKKTEVGILDQLAQACFYLGDYVNALSYAQKSLEISEKMADRTRQSKALNILSMISIRKGDFEKGREYSQEAFRIFSETDDKKWMSIALNNIGISYDMQGNYGKALEYYLKSLTIKEELGDKAIIG
ncbi:MAG: tetratricopeptide repeat protein, partial [Acidobacteria bacterium]|nr:tetratricopeptide repeat protein [Acidobacteriota bacterium]